MRKMTEKELAKAARNGKYHRKEIREAVEEMLAIPHVSGKITVQTQKTDRNEEKP